MTELRVAPEGLISTIRTLIGRGFNMLVDLFGVEMPSGEMQVMYHFLKIPENERVVISTQVLESTELPSITPTIKGADWFEREVYDMFGIRFRGHPDLRRILMPEDFRGYPLRKDFPVCGYKFLGGKFSPAFVRRDEEIDEFEAGKMFINIGPSHPATHGTLRIILELEGEVIRGVDLEIGYLHRGIEKLAETVTWEKFIPYTDRLNYVSAYLNNMIYAEAVERMAGIDVPERAKYIRVILGEISRIADHLVCIGTNAIDIGALTPFWYFFKVREDIYTLLEKAVGTRLTTSGARIGGVPRDFDDKMKEITLYIIDKSLPQALSDVERLLTKNRIFIDRTRGVGVVKAEDALAWGFTGPCLRASGIAWDLRKDSTYSVYGDFDFEVPIATEGDTYSRYLVRMEEMRQSAKIVRQALKKMPPGEIIAKDFKRIPPPKDLVFSKVESLIRHYKIVAEGGIRPPEGWFYFSGEATNGELGYFMFSNGRTEPWRLRIRSPCFAIYQAFREMLLGHKVADVVAILASLNIVVGELDR